MGYSSIDTSFSYNNWLDGEVMGSKPTMCMCNLQQQQQQQPSLSPNIHLKKLFSCT